MFYQGKFDKVLKQSNANSTSFQQPNPKLARSTIERYSKSPDSLKSSYLDNSPSLSILSRNSKDFTATRDDRSPIRYSENSLVKEKVKKNLSVVTSQKEYYYNLKSLNLNQSQNQNLSQSATKLKTAKTPSTQATLVSDNEEIHYRDKVGKLIQK